MIRKNIIDEYFEKQPELTFIKDLKESRILRIDRKKKPQNGEIAVEKIFIDRNDFSDCDKLKHSMDDLAAFISFNNLNGDDTALNILREDGLSSNKFVISIEENRICIRASEKEQVRRALIELQDEMVIGGGCLKKGEVRRKEILENRISRCFFSPINRPPKNIEELSCDTDFYPDGYLNKLMHDGVNAVWITSSFASLIKSSYITEFGEGSDKRIKRLNETIEKCAGYGIKVYLLLIEPISLDEDSIKREFHDLYKKYPQVRGNSTSGPAAFCTFTEFGENYLKEAVKNLFSSAKNLGGIISITWGERVSSCANSWPDGKGKWSNNCPHCHDKTRAEIVAHTVKIIVDAMKSVAPQAEFISWTYGHRGVPFGEVAEYIEKVPTEAVSMQNFEDDGRVLQLGKKRFALDYYLCYTGPSDMFKFTAEKAKEYDKRLYAKMQICCSHELASMPFIPVPGIVYDKMERAKAIGVSGVLESWFFGNYPCIMSKAVGLLSYNRKYLNKNDFLRTLSALYFRRENVAFAVKAFNYFEKAYKNYPVNVMFNYYGPMHDGIVWEYALKPKNFSLPRTWKLEDKPDGDRIGECLFTGHTLDEAIALCQKIVRFWKCGCKELSRATEKNEITRVAEALLILFKSGLNALMFYKLRDDLGYMNTVSLDRTLDEMKVIVRDEIKNSDDMYKICLENNAFGYHSEAEGFKFFPEKLKKRAKKLSELLFTEFEEVKNRINKGLYPLDYYIGEEAEIKKYKSGKTLQDSEWEVLDDSVSKFKVCASEKIVEMEFMSDKEVDFWVCNEFHLMFPKPTYIFGRDGKAYLFRDAASHQSVLDEKIEQFLCVWEIENLSSDGKTHIIVRGRKSNVGFKRLPYKMMVRTSDGANWCKDPLPVRVLGKSTTSPADFGWVL